MTVSVRLPGGGADDYKRFGDVYVKRPDGVLEVVRVGAETFRYAAGEWTDVEGDQRKRKSRRFWR
ncbi:hypothetical protein ACN27E_13565 [Mycobacterium sp. WMMD1722]|uniref:hypothetical protein n=1 Tax=Mycobacterium sp. WMMD1722 TaxID=3404117 RepID=UPI003BF4609F